MLASLLQPSLEVTSSGDSFPVNGFLSNKSFSILSNCRPIMVTCSSTGILTVSCENSFSSCKPTFSEPLVVFGLLTSTLVESSSPEPRRLTISKSRHLPKVFLGRLPKVFLGRLHTGGGTVGGFEGRGESGDIFFLNV